MITNQLCLVLLGSYRFFSRKFHDRDPLSSVLSCFCFFFYPFLGGELFGQVKFISGFFPSSDLIFPFIFIFCKWANEPLLDLKANRPGHQEAQIGSESDIWQPWNGETISIIRFFVISLFSFMTFVTAMLEIVLRVD